MNRRIADTTLEHLSSDGSGTQADVEAFKAACWNYQTANTCTDDEAIDAIWGDGDYAQRVDEWAPGQAEAADLQRAI